jgi:epoxyqueuosine reductase
MDARETLQKEAEERGFTVTWAPVTLPREVKTRYKQWIANGQQATMGQLMRAVDVRLAPDQRLAWAKSVMVLAVPHAFPDPGIPAGGVRIGLVGRLFWLREQDYTRLLVDPHLEALKDLCYKLGGRCSDYIDQGPLSLRSYAASSGLGWIGRNAMLLNQQNGSYLTLAVLLTSFEVELPPFYPNRCGQCQLCVSSCPTGALLGDGTLNAGRCISYWTTQHRDLIPFEMWEGIGNWLYGCDICQTVCPWNRKSEAFWQEYRAEAELAHPDLTDFFLLSEMELKQKYLRSAFERSGRTHITRNALIVLANTNDPSYLSLIRLAAQDQNPLIRATAAWALLKLGDPQMAAKLLNDPSEMVRREAQQAIQLLAR